MEFGSSWLTAVSKVKSAGERQHPPCAPSLTKADLISSLVSHRANGKHGMSHKFVAQCGFYGLQWEVDVVSSVISENAVY